MDSTSEQNPKKAARCSDYTGRRFGKLLVLRRADRRDKGDSFWEVECDCGKVTVARASSMRDGQSSCGCIYERDFVGYRKGKITITKRLPETRFILLEYVCDCGKVGTVRFSHLEVRKDLSCGCARQVPMPEVTRYGILTVTGTEARRYVCVCDCGKIVSVEPGELRFGKKSCGCLGGLKHGCCNTKEYTAWGNMNHRCATPQHPKYPSYGGRGIYVCKRWHDFAAFFADMGLRPADKHSIDRINNDGSYTCGKHDLCDDCREKNAPANCRWATCKEQQNNTRANRYITYQGRTQSVAEWAQETGISANTIRTRHDRGESDLFRPVRATSESR